MNRRYIVFTDAYISCFFRVFLLEICDELCYT